jgi:hypothetical protein
MQNAKFNLSGMQKRESDNADTILLPLPLAEHLSTTQQYAVALSPHLLVNGFLAGRGLLSSR